MFQEGNAFTLEALQHQVESSALAFSRLLKHDTMHKQFSKQDCSITVPVHVLTTIQFHNNYPYADIITTNTSMVTCDSNSLMSLPG